MIMMLIVYLSKAVGSGVSARKSAFFSLVRHCHTVAFVPDEEDGTGLLSSKVCHQP